MSRFIGFAAASLLLVGCSSGPRTCKSVSDCVSGQVCVQGECRGGNGVGGGAGAGNSGGGAGNDGGGGGGGGNTMFTGCDPHAADNATRDTDCDGLSDLEEYNTDYGGGAHTDPCNSDSDGDGISDGVEMGKTTSVSPACTSFVGDQDVHSKTNPTAADTDGDGLSDGEEDANHNGKQDGTEPNPTKRDSDCDGYSDKEELDGVPGCVTSPILKDTDGDGLQDGVEGGLQPVGADPQGCTYSPMTTFDADNATKTNPCNADTDGDGIQDGAEDINLNGKVDPGELNPNNAADGMGPAQQACATANLRPVTFNSNGIADVQLALTPGFSEVSKLTDSTGLERGFVFYDPTAKVATLVLSKMPAGTDGTSEEAAGRAKIGSVSNPLVQTFTTWDTFAGSARATYDLAGNSDVKTQLNTIAQNYLGNTVTGVLSGTGGVTGPFKVQAEYVHRTSTRAVVVIAVVPAALYAGQALFEVDDTAGGTALAQYGDSATTTCEVFGAEVNQKVDFLWVVDDSCSMASSQAAVGAAGTLFGQKLQGAGLDWRAAAATTGYYGSWNGSYRDWTTSVATMQSWFGGSNTFGTGGSGQEEGLAGMESFLNKQGPSNPKPTAFRTDASLHFIFLTDTHDQSSITPAQISSAVSSAYPGQHFMAHGIICPEGQTCGDDSEDTPGKYHTFIRQTGGVLGNIMTFKPASPSAAQQAQQQATIDAILAAAIGGTGHQLQKPPISATIKVSIATTRGTCTAADVPRDRTNGWDYDPATKRIVFYGNCIPSAAGVSVAVSYKYWTDGSPDPNGDPCGATCVAPLACDPMTKSCVCPTMPACGGCGAGLACNAATCICEPGIN